MTRNVYGKKCFRCTHIDGSTHDVEPRFPVERDECPRCLFCQEGAILGVLIREASVEADLFSPEVRQAVRDFRAGKPNSIIDKLRAEIISGDDQEAVGGDQ